MITKEDIKDLRLMLTGLCRATTKSEQRPIIKAMHEILANRPIKAMTLAESLTKSRGCKP